jgi:hypothetical protein
LIGIEMMEYASVNLKRVPATQFKQANDTVEFYPRIY